MQRGVAIGPRLKALRKAAGWNQEQAAAKVGIRRTELSRHENGKPVGEVVGERFAKAYGVDVKALLAQPATTEPTPDEDDSRLDGLLAELAAKADGVDAVVAEVLLLLARRLRLAESQLAGRAQRGGAR